MGQKNENEKMRGPTHERTKKRTGGINTNGTGGTEGGRPSDFLTKKKATRRIKRQKRHHSFGVDKNHSKEEKKEVSRNPRKIIPMRFIQPPNPKFKIQKNPKKRNQ